MTEDTYLGDGLYARYDGFQVELYASDGTNKTNRVFLDGAVLSSFVVFLKEKGFRFQ